MISSFFKDDIFDFNKDPFFRNSFRPSSFGLDSIFDSPFHLVIREPKRLSEYE